VPTRPLTVPSDGQWHEVSVDLTPQQLGGNMVLLRLGLAGTRAGSVAGQAVDFDDVSFVEWRAADGEAGPHDFVRNNGADPATVAMDGYAY